MNFLRNVQTHRNIYFLLVLFSNSVLLVSFYPGFRAEIWWFELWNTIRKSMFTISTVIFAPSGVTMQTWAALVLLLFYFAVFLISKPYDKPYLNQLERNALSINVVTLLLGVGLFTNDRAGADAKSESLAGLITVAIIASNAFFVLNVVWTLSKYSQYCSLCKRKKSSLDENSLVRVQPTTLLTRGLSLKQIKKAVDHDHVVKIQVFHEKQHKASLDAIRAREKIADARVRARLIERRNKKNLQTQTQARQKTQNEDLKSWKAAPDTDANSTVSFSSTKLSPVELVEVEKVRLMIQGKVKTMKKLNRLFAKLDVDHNGMMSKKEFVALVETALKKKVKETVVDLVWNAVWEERKHGENDEMDASTLGHWLKLE